MEHYLTFKASFQDESKCAQVAKIFKHLLDRVEEVDEEIRKDESNTDTCFQTYFPQATELAHEFIDDVSSLLNMPWNAGLNIDKHVIKEIVRGLDEVITAERNVQIDIMVSGYDREVIKLLLPLLSEFGSISVSASGTNDEDFHNVDNYKLTGGEIHYKSTTQ